jgi:hypothetical protein
VPLVIISCCPVVVVVMIVDNAICTVRRAVQLNDPFHDAFDSHNSVLNERSYPTAVNLKKVLFFSSQRERGKSSGRLAH